MGSPSPSASTSPKATTGPGDDPPRNKPPRKLNRSANQLHRNQACLTCRRRRIKCDAARPHCSSCVRSFRFLARTQPDPERDARGVQCVYENNEPEEPEPEDPRAAVAKLEARVAELQGELDRLTSTSPRISTTPVLTMTPSQRAEHTLPSPSIPQDTSPSIPQHLFTPPHLWPNMELDPTAQHFVPPPFDPGFPYGTTGIPTHPHQHQHQHQRQRQHQHPSNPTHPGHQTSPVSSNSEPLSWPGQGGPSMPSTPFHMPDGNQLDLELGPSVDDAMTRYVEMSMGGMRGMGGGPRPSQGGGEERPHTGGRGD
ncbi:hypothetical protein CcaverHIS002_0409390 [Cutaneotrichosporon cavernicola]|uniref:Zn(2)-C6 fungal-type domain-containing protein n=1 Tax=Cutaneotrichosporon cavernicola TaxID=279322 RepID=A0AA48L532_9TREE|nr:uncharacterized protein CcaverHIS019_0409320 [Cutaneotrichosporon cavernicola]BEI84335.1 hypothetical protein CcaverHIS002_0409390 [Cutaneotrichosporon cavernicola]BEI92112.1 hypothetical protein CcaverHIS019_0409320 [Cutaneotrichosporon cavernicola]BEI99882.1 hypothetical protein CcaverHIS631_0409250 [Cutaneotrichosporon cavernicola]